MHATSRSVVTAARTHPAGIAAPSAVIVTAIILFTLVTSVVVPAIPPGLSGIGSAPAIAPSTDQPRHQVQPQPVPTGPPILPGLPHGTGGNVPNPSGGNVASPSGGNGPRPVGGPACYAGRVPGPAAVTAVSGTGNALQAVTRAVTSGPVVPAVRSGLTAVSGSAIQRGPLVSSVASAAPVKVTVSPVKVTVPPVQVTAASATVRGAAQVTVDGTGSVNATRSVESSVEQALPGAGSLAGAG